MPPWLDRGFESAGFIGCILASALLLMAVRASRADRRLGEGHEGLLVLLAALVLVAFFVGAAIF